VPTSRCPVSRAWTRLRRAPEIRCGGRHDVRPDDRAPQLSPAGVQLSRGQSRAEMHAPACGLGVSDVCPSSRGKQSSAADRRNG
jgi:hypothetical protein